MIRTSVISPTLPDKDHKKMNSNDRQTERLADYFAIVGIDPQLNVIESLSDSKFTSYYQANFLCV